MENTKQALSAIGLVAVVLGFGVGNALFWHWLADGALWGLGGALATVLAVPVLSGVYADLRTPSPRQQEETNDD